MTTDVPYTAEYLQHHAVARPDKRRAAYSKFTMLDALLEDGLIDKDQWFVGDRYRTDLEIADRGAYTSDYDAVPGGGGDLAPTEQVVLARRRRAEVERSMAPAHRVALLALAYDAGWSALSRALNGVALPWQTVEDLPAPERTIRRRIVKNIAAAALTSLLPIYIRRREETVH